MGSSSKSEALTSALFTDQPRGFSGRVLAEAGTHQMLVNMRGSKKLMLT